MKIKIYSKQKIFTLLSFSFIGIIGCSSSTSIYNDDHIESDSTFISRNAGAQVYIAMNSGEEFSGELLTVSDSTMTLCEMYNASEQELADSIYAIHTLNNQGINLIEIRVESKAIYGILLGGVTSAYIGLKAGNADPTGSCIIGGLIGAFTGGIIAFITTNKETVYEQANPEEYDFTQLNIYARYVNNEPDYLKKIK